MIQDKYLRFTKEQMLPHFLKDAEKQVEYFEKSAERYRDFLAMNPDTKGIPITQARLPRQIEKDERFWTAASLKHLFDSPERNAVLDALLRSTFGEKPPVEGLGTWRECLSGEMALYFEAQAPSPQTYVNWLRRNLSDRQFIPYILDAADRENERTLEGATHFDAALVNRDNGFSLLIEAKVLSDISTGVSFDSLRNQLARCIDVMLEPNPNSNDSFGRRNPERSLFILLTPELFRRHPHSRLYGWLFKEYKESPQALERDLPHRSRVDSTNVASRLGWITFEDIERHSPGACPWLTLNAAIAE